MIVEDAVAPVNGASVHIGTSLVRTEALTTDGVPPAYDEDAAQRHIASMLIDTEMCASLGEHGLTHRDYVGPERLIVQAIEGCLSDGIEPGYVNVGIYLTDHHMMGGVGGFHVLTRMCGQMGLRSHGEVKRDAERVRRHSLARQLRQDHHVAAAECTADPMKVEDIFDRFTAKMLALRARTTPHFEGVGTSTIFGELSPEPYLIPDLSIGPGLPTMIAGYSHSGKTMILMDMLLDLAAGQAVWGSTYAVTKACKCLHINYDQPARVTFDRYQRLLKPKSYNVADIEGRLEVVNRPGEFLNSPTAKPRLLRRLEGVDVCLIDSLMAALPGEKENESSIRKYIDELGEVSEATGCTIILIHHSGKPRQGEEKEGKPDLRMSPRGSSAIVDAIDNLFHVRPDPEEPIYHIAQAKNRSAGSKVTLSIRHENGPGYIRLSLKSQEEGATPTPAPAGDELHETRVAIILFLSNLKDKRFNGTRANLSLLLKRKHQLVTTAIALLHTEGKVELGNKGDPYVRSLL